LDRTTWRTLFNSGHAAGAKGGNANSSIGGFFKLKKPFFYRPPCTISELINYRPKAIGNNCCINHNTVGLFIVKRIKMMWATCNYAAANTYHAA